MAAPQTVLDALEQLVADQGDVASKRDDAAAKGQAALEAAHASEVADNAVNATVQKFVEDKRALIALIDSTFVS